MCIETEELLYKQKFYFLFIEKNNRKIISKKKKCLCEGAISDDEFDAWEVSQLLLLFKRQHNLHEKKVPNLVIVQPLFNIIRTIDEKTLAWSFINYLNIQLLLSSFVLIFKKIVSINEFIHWVIPTLLYSYFCLYICDAHLDKILQKKICNFITKWWSIV